ncbi:Kinesin-like protein KIN-14B [Sarracenia purpurea var. burkii]
MLSDSNNKGQLVDGAASPMALDKTQGTIALVKSGIEQVKRTPAGEYLTAALNDFDSDQYAV